MRLCVSVLSLLAILALAPASAGRTWYITPDGSGDAPTIQAGVDSAAVGDTVEVSCGTYYEHDVLITSAVVLRSTSGHADCVTIDAQRLGRVLFISWVSDAVSLTGLTLQGGVADSGSVTSANRGVHGGGLYLDHCDDFSMEHCLVRDNSAAWRGGGLAAFESHVRLIDCTFRDNHAQRIGGSSLAAAAGGVYAYEGHLALLDCTITDNSTGPWPSLGGGIHSTSSATVEMDGCFVARNVSAAWGGGAFFTYGASAQSCTFIDNQAGTYGGGVAAGGTFERAQLHRCLFTGNTAPAGAGLSCRVLSLSECTVSHNNGGGILFTSPPQAGNEIRSSIVAYNAGPSIDCGDLPQEQMSVTCSNVYGNMGGDWVDCIAPALGTEGNFSADPFFCDPAHGDFTLAADSPCLPGNHPTGWDCGLIGALGQGCGPVALTPQTWARIKAKYR